ncbi:hypothetical protein P7C73_g6218, partial [Tremellales sp. Uapishka_1]
MGIEPLEDDDESVVDDEEILEVEEPERTDVAQAVVDEQDAFAFDMIIGKVPRVVSDAASSVLREWILELCDDRPTSFKASAMMKELDTRMDSELGVFEEDWEGTSLYEILPGT